MNDPVLGEIIMFASNSAPPGYALCDGREMDIAQNQELYNLIGTTYGGDGATMFNLPDLRGRVPIGPNETYVRAVPGGEESHVLTGLEMPNHTHPMMASSDEANSIDPTGNLVAPSQVDGGNVFSAPTAAPDVHFSSQAIGATGGGEAHNNMQPSLVVNFCIAITGTTPPRP